jgi:hypothetical protein
VASVSWGIGGRHRPLHHHETLTVAPYPSPSRIMIIATTTIIVVLLACRPWSACSPQRTSAVIILAAINTPLLYATPSH